MKTPLPDNPVWPTEGVLSQRQSADWDINNAFKNYSVLIISQFILGLFSFASVWVIVRYLGAEQYGGVVAVIAASQMLQIFLHWTGTACIRFGVEEFVTTGKMRSVFWGRIYILTPNILVVLGITLLWFTPLSDWFKLPASAWYLVISNVAVGGIWLHLQYTLQGLKLPKIQGLLSALEKVSLFILVLGLTYTGYLSVQSVVICYSLAPLAMCGVALWVVRKAVSVPSSFSADLTKKILLFSLPLFPYAIIGFFFTSSLDAIFILRYLTRQDLAVYAVAAQIMGVILQFPILANTLLLPMFVTMEANSESERVNNYFLHVLPLFTISWSALCLSVAFLGQSLLPLVFGEEFVAIQKPYWLLITAVSFGAPSYFGNAALANANLLPNVSLYSSLCTALTNIALDIILIPKYGLIGCAWATVAAHLVSVVSFTFFLRRRVPVKLSWVPMALLPAIIQLGILTISNTLIFPAIVWLAGCLIVLTIFQGSARKGITTLLNYL